MITAPIVQPSCAPSSSNSHHSPTAVIGSFDGAAGLWKNENELLNIILSIAARRQCESTLALIKSLEKDLRNHFISEAKNLIFLRKNNTIGYREKWLHSLLIKKMQDGNLPRLDLE